MFLADAGYRVVAPDLRGYGQTDAPSEVDDYDQTHIVGDVVGLMNAVGEESAVLVGQDFGPWVGYYSVAMRPELFTGLFMMCSPPSPRPARQHQDVAQAVDSVTVRSALRRAWARRGCATIARPFWSHVPGCPAMRWRVFG